MIYDPCFYVPAGRMGEGAELCETIVGLSCITHAYIGLSYRQGSGEMYSMRQMSGFARVILRKELE